MKKLLLLFATVFITASVSAATVLKDAHRALAPKNTPSVRTFTPNANFGELRLSTLNRFASNGVRRAPKKASSVNDLVGSYVVTLVGYQYNECYDVTVSALGTDSVNIAGLSYYGNIHAKVNLTNGTLEIPSQKEYTDDTYGACSIAKVDTLSENWSPLRNQNIIATIYDTGEIEINDLWALYIDSGTYAGYYFDCWYYSLFEKPNGRFTAVQVTSSSQNFVRDNVVIRQINDSTLTISNLENMYVEGFLTKDSLVFFPKQYVYSGGSRGDYYMIGYYYYENDSTLSEDPDSITLGTGKGGNKSIRLNPFTFINQSNYWFGLYYNNVITFTSDDVFTYPKDEATGIRNVNAGKKAVRTDYYSISGTRTASPQKGLNIAVTRFDDGTTVTRKIINK